MRKTTTLPRDAAAKTELALDTLALRA